MGNARSPIALPRTPTSTKSSNVMFATSPRCCASAAIRMAAEVLMLDIHPCKTRRITTRMYTFIVYLTGRGVNKYLVMFRYVTFTILPMRGAPIPGITCQDEAHTIHSQFPSTNAAHVTYIHTIHAILSAYIYISDRVMDGES